MENFIAALIKSFFVGVVTLDEAEQTLDSAKAKVGVVKEWVLNVERALFEADIDWDWESGWYECFPRERAPMLNLRVYCEDHGVVNSVLQPFLDGYTYADDGESVDWDDDVYTPYGWASLRAMRPEDEMRMAYPG